MTDQLILTTAQRASIENLLAEVGFDKRPLVKVSNMLQSLPMVSGEPVAWRRFDAIDVAWHVELTTNDDYDGWQPLYTSPQPLQHISADDVTDEMQSEIINQRTVYLSKKCVAAVVNVFINCRSEAK